mgnify:CR=1 FL=1
MVPLTLIEELRSATGWVNEIICSELRSISRARTLCKSSTQQPKTLNDQAGCSRSTQVGNWSWKSVKPSRIQLPLTINSIYIAWAEIDRQGSVFGICIPHKGVQGSWNGWNHLDFRCFLKFRWSNKPSMPPRWVYTFSSTHLTVRTKRFAANW